VKRYLERIQEVSMQDYILTKDTTAIGVCLPKDKDHSLSRSGTQNGGTDSDTTMYYSLLNLMTQFAEISGNQQGHN
jgi:alpha-L-rhamnosidase